MLCVFLNGMCPSYFFVLFYFIFFSPEVPERNPCNFFLRRSRRGTLETLLFVFFSSPSFVVRRVSMGILETDTWPKQDHKRESTLAQTFEELYTFVPKCAEKHAFSTRFELLSLRTETCALLLVLKNLWGYCKAVCLGPEGSEAALHLQKIEDELKIHM